MAEGTADPDPISTPMGVPPSHRQAGPCRFSAGLEAVGLVLKAALMACDARKLILAVVGLLALKYGWLGIDLLFDGDGDRLQYARIVGMAFLLPWMEGPPDVLAVLDPVLTLSRPFADLLDPAASLTEWSHAGLAAVWEVLVWGLVGGAIARVAMTDVSGGERPGVIRAIRYAAGRASALIAAPLAPLVGLGLFAVVAAGVGLLFRIPSVGPAIGGSLAFVPLSAGVVMALIVVGLAAGWPLMTAAVAAEGEDAFDALSRSYGYIYQRPWHFVGLATVALLAGSIGFLYVRGFAALTVHLANFGLSIGGPREFVLSFQRAWTTGEFDDAGGPQGFWLRVVDLFVIAWTWAYLWSAASAIYLALRRMVDGEQYEVIYRRGEELEEFAGGPSEPGLVADPPQS